MICLNDLKNSIIIQLITGVLFVAQCLLWPTVNRVCGQPYISHFIRCSWNYAGNLCEYSSIATTPTVAATQPPDHCSSGERTYFARGGSRRPKHKTAACDLTASLWFTNLMEGETFYLGDVLFQLLEASFALPENLDLRHSVFAQEAWQHGKQNDMMDQEEVERDRIEHFFSRVCVFLALAPPRYC